MNHEVANTSATFIKTVNWKRSQLFGNSEQFKRKVLDRSQEIWNTTTST